MITFEIRYNTNDLDFKEANKAVCDAVERDAHNMEFKYESAEAARAAMSLVTNLGYRSKLKVYLREG